MDRRLDRLMTRHPQLLANLSLIYPPAARRASAIRDGFSARNSTSSPLLALPAEIRILIYKATFAGVLDSGSKALTLLQTCRQIYAEAAEIGFGSVAFTISPTILGWRLSKQVRRLNPTTAERIRSIHLDFGTVKWPSPFSQLSYISSIREWTFTARAEFRLALNKKDYLIPQDSVALVLLVMVLWSGMENTKRVLFELDRKANASLFEKCTPFQPECLELIAGRSPVGNFGGHSIGVTVGEDGRWTFRCLDCGYARTLEVELQELV